MAGNVGLVRMTGIVSLIGIFGIIRMIVFIGRTAKRNLYKFRYVDVVHASHTSLFFLSHYAVNFDLY
jgi:hypothetical protein